MSLLMMRWILKMESKGFHKHIKFSLIGLAVGYLLFWGIVNLLFILFGKPTNPNWFATTNFVSIGMAIISGFVIDFNLILGFVHYILWLASKIRIGF